MNSSDISKIQIFIVTRNEVKNEFLEISDFINEINRHLERAYSLSIDLMTIEDMDAPDWKQAEYRKKICESEMVFFLIFMKMEDFLIEDFEAAFEKLKNDGKPDIYTYFYQGIGTERDKNVQKFMDRLGNEIGHYWSIYSHIDTIKLKILMCLKLSKLDMVEMVFRDGKLVIDEKDIMPLDNVKMFAENYTIKYLTEKQAKIEKEYIAAKSLYLQNKQDKEICQKYLNLVAERENILKNIEETEKQLFKQSLNMIKTAKGELTERQREAYRLFEDGKSEAANKILDSEEIKRDFRIKMKKREKEDKKLAAIHISEFKTKIEILETMTEYMERFEDIIDAYEEITKTAFKYNVEYDYVRIYIEFLHAQGNNKKALEIAKSLEEIYIKNPLVSKYEKGSLLNALGSVASFIPDMQKESEKYYLKSLEIAKELIKDNSEIHYYIANLAATYYGIAEFYLTQRKIKEAETFYLEAIKIIEEFAKNNFDELYSYLDLVRVLAPTYSSVGICYYIQGKTKEAETFYLAALKIYKELVKKNPDRFSAGLGNNYDYMGIFYANQGKTKEAETFYLAALKIYKELVKKNPNRFSADLAILYYNYGNFKKETKYFEMAVNLAKNNIHNPECRKIINDPQCAMILLEQEYKRKAAERGYFQTMVEMKDYYKENDKNEFEIIKSYEDKNCITEQTRRTINKKNEGKISGFLKKIFGGNKH